MLNLLKRGADDLLWFVTDAMGGSSRRWSEICTSDLVDPDLIVLHDGTCVTLLEARGLKILSADAMPKLIDTLTDKLPGPLERGQILTFDYERDPGGGRGVMRANNAYARRALQDHGLDLGDLLDEREQVMGRYVVAERAWIGVWTPPTRDKRERKAAQADLEVYRRQMPRGTAGLLVGFEGTRRQHRSTVAEIVTLLDAAQYDARPISARQAIGDTRRWLFPNSTGPYWQPALLGDHARVSVRNPARLFEGAAPPVADQIFVGDVTSDGTHVTCDRRVYRLFGLKLGPSETEPFSRLVERAAHQRIPMRVRMRLGGGGMAALSGGRVALARILAWDPVSGRNKQVDAAAQALKRWVQFEHGFVSDFRVQFATWGADTAEADARSSQLRQLVESWGSGAARPLPSDRMARPARAWARMAPALSSKCDSWILPAPLVEAAWMLPLSRPVSPWAFGSVDLRTDDGRLYPVDPVSRLQTARVTLGFAPMRMGKSLFSNGRVLSLLVRAGQPRLPRVLIVDSGWSSLGLIQILRDAVGQERRDLFQHYRIQMDPKRFAFNPFDLPLGFRAPMATQRQFLTNLLMILCTPLDSQTPPGPVAGFLDLLLDAAYERAAPENRPRPYYPGMRPEVDQEIDRYLKEKPATWWDAADGLFDAGRLSAARWAQAHAMPLLQEVAGMARDSQINAIYAETRVEGTGETVPEYVFRAITEAVRAIPVIAFPTCFDPGAARVLALDLGDVTLPSNNPRDHRQAAIMYMMARQMGASWFYIRAKDIESVPDSVLPHRYRAHVESIARDVEDDVKEIVYDEFHRTGGHRGIQQQVIVDIREGPKYNVGIALFSQRPEDFDPTMRNLATSLWIFGAGQGDDLNNIVQMFGFSEHARRVLATQMRKPDKDGSHVFVRTITQYGSYEAKLRYTRGPTELWALSTTPADNALRSALTRRVGAKEARKRLAAAFPGGSAEEEIERKTRERIERSGGDAEEVGQGVAEEMAASLAKET